MRLRSLNTGPTTNLAECRLLIRTSAAEYRNGLVCLAITTRALCFNER